MVDLGGFVRDPGGMVWGHPRGADPALTLQTGLEDDEVAPGTHVMFDCHGTLDLYCWDGGKTWVVEGEPEGGAKQFAKATAAVAEALLEAMRPGVRVSELQARAREVYRKEGVPDPAAAVIFFHGLGLSHMDIEQTTADGKSEHRLGAGGRHGGAGASALSRRRARAHVARGGDRRHPGRRPPAVLLGLRAADRALSAGKADGGRATALSQRRAVLLTHGSDAGTSRNSGRPAEIGVFQARSRATNSRPGSSQVVNQRSAVYALLTGLVTTILEASIKRM